MNGAYERLKEMSKDAKKPSEEAFREVMIVAQIDQFEMIDKYHTEVKTVTKKVEKNSKFISKTKGAFTVISVLISGGVLTSLAILLYKAFKNG